MESSAYILFEDAFLQVGISEDRVKPITSPLYNFTGASASVKGRASLTVVVGEAPQQATHTLDPVASCSLDLSSPHEVSYAKRGWICEGRSDAARKCYVTSCRPEETFSIDDQRDEATVRNAEPVEALIHVSLAKGNDKRQVQIGFALESGLRDQLVSFIRSNMDIFAWSAADMPGIDPSMITHRLSVLQGAEQRYLNTEKLAFALLIAARKLCPCSGHYPLREVHEGICGQHLGGCALAHKVLRRGYYWPTMQQDAMNYTKKCEACQLFSSIPRRAPSPLSMLSSPIPFAMWGMDIMGPFPPVTAQCKFVIVAIDYFTK
ncbi:hypothetical protein RJ639_007129 [Escallonia herrerae]|uniref:Integrase zinc-binding domain-containing protein n=1 Tax=Escallonia herrerae TaxID=1293975 RepID=A0AA88VXD5_9ASTE|nr:hypothetical protein RJ639_007129 [Escallonia herrerae]